MPATPIPVFSESFSILVLADVTITGNIQPSRSINAVVTVVAGERPIDLEHRMAAQLANWKTDYTLYRVTHVLKLPIVIQGDENDEMASKLVQQTAAG